MSVEEELGIQDRRQILSELHQHARMNMQMWTQWFAFFTGINYAAYGWFAQALISQTALNRAAVNLKPLTYVAALLSSQCALGIWVSLSFRTWLKKNDSEMTRAYESFPRSIESPVYSYAFYAKAVLLAIVALFCMLAALIWLAYKSIY